MDACQEGGAGDRLRARYRALQAGGRAARRPGAGAGGRGAGRARRRARRLRAGHRPERLARSPARPGPAAGAAPRPLPPRPGRARQVDADGPVLRGGAGRRQAPGPLPCLHARGPRPARPPAPAGRRRGSDPLASLADALVEPGLAAVLRRVPRPQHRRRDDPRAPVRGAARARHGRRRDLELRPRAALRGRPQPRPLPAVHRAAAAAARGGGARRAPTDYRLERLRDVPTYHQPLGPATDGAGSSRSSPR